MINAFVGKRIIYSAVKLVTLGVVFWSEVKVSNCYFKGKSLINLYGFEVCLSLCSNNQS